MCVPMVKYETLGLAAKYGLNDVREGLSVIRDSAWSRGPSAVADLLVCSGQGRNTQSNTDGPRFSANLDQILACGFLKIPRKVIRVFLQKYRVSE